jgi:hypothetical protein
MKMKKMIKAVSINGLAVATVVLVSGCGARPHYPQTIVSSYGLTYHPTWDGYGSCKTYQDRPNAECSVEKDGPVVKILEPDIDATMNSFIRKYSSIDELCNTVEKLQLIPGYSCTATVRDRLLKANNYEKAYNWGLIDQKTWLLHDGKIVEAYEAGLIDKDTADLYLQKQAMDNATRAAQQQADAARRAANAAEDANSANLLNQSLQNIQNYNQMNQMINQQNINNNMRKYY